MSKDQVYLVNHGRAMKFPWSLYHAPLIHSLNEFLKGIPNPQGKKILVIGPGDLQELPLLKDLGLEVSLLDIDQRVLEKLAALVSETYLVDENFEGYPNPESFDAIYAKEVIEHLPDPHPFIKKVYAILKPGGMVWMSTPNYGFFLLPLLEKTILEVIARLSGFSRRDIHPTKFNKTQLESLFKAHEFKIRKTEVTFAGLALSLWATKGNSHQED
jgi:2-polyprenyl-3-methyl-5-hydroxy-6-metoxy-1,4-benzoquinol methylase